MYKQKKKIEMYPCGLVVNQKIKFIGASPDGHLVDPNENNANGVLEIKCPLWNSLNEGVNDSNKYLMLCEKTGNFILDRNLNYYSQIQGQMLVCGVNWGDFVIYVKKTDEINIERIYYDPCYCELLLDKLHSMYCMYAVPYLLNSQKENLT